VNIGIDATAMWERCPNAVKWYFSSSRMELVQGGVRPLVFLICTMFLIAGVLLFNAALGSASPIWSTPNPQNHALAAMLCVFAVAFISIPFGHLFRREGASIDTASSTVAVWRSMIIPVHRQSYDLRQYDHVSIRRKCGSRRNGPPVQYAVVLQNSHDVLELVHQINSQLSAEHLAKRISELCDLPLH
jgi:hypothetical protein